MKDKSQESAEWAEKYAKHQAIQAARDTAHDAISNWVLEEEDDRDVEEDALA